MASIKEVTLAELRDELKSEVWSNKPLHFLGDIGGTNARLGFGMGLKNGNVKIIYTRFEMTEKDINQIKQFFDEILRGVSAEIIKRIDSGAISVPGPVTRGKVGGPFNNLKGIAKLEEYPEQLFPRNRSALLNDLEAGGYGVLAVSDAGAFKEYFKILWKGSQWDQLEPNVKVGDALGRGRCFVIAPGTGVGTSLINYDALADIYNVLSLEYSSTSVTVNFGNEAYLRDLAKELNTPKFVPNMESVSNGAAIEFNYKRLAGKKLRIKEIATLAKNGDETAKEAMMMALRELFRSSSEGCMLFLPLTCILIGDNIIHNDFLFDNETFLNKLKNVTYAHPMEQQYKFISRTTFLRQKKSTNLNLLGCYGFGTHNQCKKKLLSNL